MGRLEKEPSDTGGKTTSSSCLQRHLSPHTLHAELQLFAKASYHLTITKPQELEQAPRMAYPEA